MKKVVAGIVLALGAIFWAKKHFIDPPPRPEPPSKLEVAAEKVGGAIAGAKALQSAAANKPDEQGISALLSSITSRKSGGTPEEKAKARLNAFLAAWKEGGTSVNDAAQAAACLWSRGVRFIPNGYEIQDAANGFDRWRHSHGLYTELQSYSVGEVVARESNPGRGDYSMVEVEINGKTYRIGVPDAANPIFMIE